jgi:hypothetical protein
MRKFSPGCFAAITLFVVAASLQWLFIVKVWNGTLPLDHSIRFASGGIPCDIASIVLAVRCAHGNSALSLIALSPSISICIWLFLITLH